MISCWPFFRPGFGAVWGGSFWLAAEGGQPNSRHPKTSPKLPRRPPLTEDEIQKTAPTSSRKKTFFFSENGPTFFQKVGPGWGATFWPQIWGQKREPKTVPNTRFDHFGTNPGIQNWAQSGPGPATISRKKNKKKQKPGAFFSRNGGRFFRGSRT